MAGGAALRAGNRYSCWTVNSHPQKALGWDCAYSADNLKLESYQVASPPGAVAVPWQRTPIGTEELMQKLLAGLTVEQWEL